MRYISAWRDALVQHRKRMQVAQIIVKARVLAGQCMKSNAYPVTRLERAEKKSDETTKYITATPKVVRRGEAIHRRMATPWDAKPEK